MKKIKNVKLDLGKLLFEYDRTVKQKDFAKDVHLREGTVSKWVREGAERITMNQIKDLMNYFGFESLDQLFQIEYGDNEIEHAE